MTHPICPYCESQAILVDASAVYGTNYEGKGNIWTCGAYPDCDAFVGATAGLEPIPVGTMANSHLRGLRKRLRFELKTRRDEAPKAATLPRPERRAAGELIRHLTERIAKVGWLTEEECLSQLSKLVGQTGPTGPSAEAVKRIMSEAGV